MSDIIIKGLDVIIKGAVKYVPKLLKTQVGKDIVWTAGTQATAAAAKQAVDHFSKDPNKAEERKKLIEHAAGAVGTSRTAHKITKKWNSKS